MVIDNISHHLRFELSRSNSIEDKVHILDEFFESVLIPLFFFCEFHKITLVFVHEVSYNPTQDKIVMFNDQLFRRLDGLKIELRKNLFTHQYYIHFHTHSQCKSYEYQIRQRGLTLLM